MKRIVSVITVFILVSSLAMNVFAQKDEVLLEIEDEKITVDEFMRVYKKNNTQGNVVDKKSVEEYLDLFINFRLKVRQAKDMGLDTAKAFKEELKGYRKQLAKPYLMDEQVQEKILGEAYKNMQYDLRASHILVRVGPDADPEDTLKAYNKIQNIRQRIINGEESFAEIAVDASEDRSARDRKRGNRTIPGNKGDLGYFTVFNLVYPFEKVAYDMEVGEISKPVRTKFGYHIIKLEDKIPAQGKLKAAHIMISNQTDSAIAHQRLDSLREQITNGNLSFEEAAKQFSDDNRTKQKGGVFPEFTSNRMPPKFIKAISKLKKEGDISTPVHTRYGTHLFKLISRDAPGSFEEEKANLKKKVSNSDRSKMQEDISAAKIREEYGYKLYSGVKENIIALVDTSILTDDWDVDMADVPEKTLFKIGSRKYPAKEFVSYLKENQKRNGQGNAKLYAETLFKKYRDQKTLDFKDSQLEKEYPEFKNLMTEYRHGILLFNLMTDKIWSKAMKDTTGLEAFYEKHKNDHMWGERLHASIFEANNKDAALYARQLAKQGLKPAIIADTVNAVDEFQLSVTTDKFSKGDNETIDQLSWEKGMNQISEENGNFIFVQKHAVLQAQPKKLDEIRGLIIANYQNYLEEKWIEELREKYDYKVHEDVLEKIK